MRACWRSRRPTSSWSSATTAPSDGTVGIINDYAQRDPRIRVSVNERNLGDYANRRHVASLAQGRFLKYHDSDDVMYPHCLATMVEPLDAEPRAAFALSGAGSWPGGPCPMLLTPRLAYEREFLGSGLFQQGPASALFRAEAFRALGGFPEIRLLRRLPVLAARVRDGERPARARRSVLLPDSPGTGDRQSSERRGARDEPAPKRGAMLNSPECPLTGDALSIGKRNFVFIQAREIYRNLKRRRVRSAADVVRYCGLGVGDWISHLRPPCRNEAAGTPIAGGGRA